LATTFISNSFYLDSIFKTVV